MTRHTLIALALLFLTGCQTLVEFDDVTGLNRGQAELDVAMARCEVYAQQTVNQQLGNAAVASLAFGSSYMLGAQMASSDAYQRHQLTCLRSQGFVPRQNQ